MAEQEQTLTPEERILGVMGMREEPQEVVADAEAPEQDEVAAENEAEALAEDGTEDEGAQEEVTEEPEVAFEEVEFNGKLYDVPIELKDALLRESDYTQKTQQLSADRKTAEVVRGQAEQLVKQFEFQQSVQEELREAQQADYMIDQWRQYKKTNLDSLQVHDIVKIDAQIEELTAQKSAVNEKIKVKAEEFQQALEQSLKELRDKSTEVLRGKIQNWSEDLDKQVRGHALNLGFTEAEVSSVADPRYLEVLYKAFKYDTLQQKKPAAAQKIASAPAIRPKARAPANKDKAGRDKVKKILKNPKISSKDKRRVFEQHLTERFR